MSGKSHATGMKGLVQSLAEVLQGHNDELGLDKAFIETLKANAASQGGGLSQHITDLKTFFAADLQVRLLNAYTLTLSNFSAL